MFFCSSRKGFNMLNRSFVSRATKLVCASCDGVVVSSASGETDSDCTVAACNSALNPAEKSNPESFALPNATLVAPELLPLEQCCSAYEILLSNASDPEAVKEEKKRLEKEFQTLSSSLNNPENLPEYPQLQARMNKAARLHGAQLHQLYQARDLERWEHYTLKLDICKKISEFLEAPDTELPAIAGELKTLRQHWREIGTVPHQKSNELWNEFRTNTSKLQSRINSYFKEQEIRRTKIFRIKQEICAEAATLATSEDWEKTAARLKELQVKWKEAGTGNRSKDQELYLNFRKSCDLFFNARTSFYAKRKEQFTIALEGKKRLCAEAAALSTLSPSEAKIKAGKLRAEWKLLPSAGRDNPELYRQFKASIDAYFDERRKQFEAILATGKSLLQQMAEVAKLLEHPNADTNKKALEEQLYNLDLAWAELELPRERRDELKRRHNKLQDEIKTNLKQFDQRQLLNKLESFRNAGVATLAENSDLNVASCAEASCQRHLLLKELESLLEVEDVHFDGDLAMELQRAMADNFGDSAGSTSIRKSNVDIAPLQELLDRWCALTVSEDFPEQCDRFERAFKRAFKQLEKR